MTRPFTRTKEEVLLLVVSAAAVGGAVLSVREATPPRPGLWLATAGALALGLAALFAFWFGGAVRRRFADSLHGEWDAARSLLSAIPDGLLVLDDGAISSVNRRLCDQLGFSRDELLSAHTPFPFWPPEHRHELEAFHDGLVAHGEHAAEVTLLRRDGDRLRAQLSGRLVDGAPHSSRYLVTVRDVSATHRRERRLTELAVRDAETGLLDGGAFEERLGHAVRQAIRTAGNVAVVLTEVVADGHAGNGVLGRPEGLLAVERLRRLARVGDELARTGPAELAWILPDTDAVGALQAVDRWRSELAGPRGLELTAGICDLESAGDALTLYALADRALAQARRVGPGATERHPSVTTHRAVQSL